VEIFFTVVKWKKH